MIGCCIEPQSGTTLMSANGSIIESIGDHLY